jgi:AcrR family transcriptional regulator
MENKLMHIPSHEGKDQPGRARRLSGDERRRALILAAYQLLAEKGFEQLRTRDIAARAGVNIATLHYYFPSKEDLILGVVEHVLQVFSGGRPPQASDSGNPLEDIRAMFLNVEHLLETASETFIVLEEIGLRSLRDESLHAAVRRLDETWRSYLEPLISTGIAQGIFRADLDTHQVATELIVLIKGLTVHQITTGQRLQMPLLLASIERWLLP